MDSMMALVLDFLHFLFFFLAYKSLLGDSYFSSLMDSLFHESMTCEVCRPPPQGQPLTRRKKHNKTNMVFRQRIT